MDGLNLEKGSKVWALIDGKPKEIYFMGIKTMNSFRYFPIDTKWERYKTLDVETYTPEPLVSKGPDIFALTMRELVEIHVARLDGMISEMHRKRVDLLQLNSLTKILIAIPINFEVRFRNDPDELDGKDLRMTVVEFRKDGSPSGRRWAHNILPGDDESAINFLEQFIKSPPKEKSTES